jgi:hypothetical protein
MSCSVPISVSAGIGMGMGKDMEMRSDADRDMDGDGDRDWYMDTDTDMGHRHENGHGQGHRHNILYWTFFYIGYRTAPMLGLSDTRVDFNIDIVTGPTWEQDSDNVFSYIGLKNPISDLGDCRHKVYWRWPLCLEHTVNSHMQI